MRVIVVVAVALLSFISCKQEVKSTDGVISNQAKEILVKNISFTIDGMMCEMNCAGTIEKKLKAASGVQDVVIDFGAKSAFVSFDANVLSTDDVVAVVEGIADGKLYKVSNVKPADSKETKMSCCVGKCQCKKSCSSDSLQSCKKKCSADSLACKKDALQSCRKRCEKDSLSCKKKKAHCVKRDTVK